jgi:hypothetical protein
VFGISESTNAMSMGVQGVAAYQGIGVVGTSESGIGIMATTGSNEQPAVYASSYGSAAVYGKSQSDTQAAVVGQSASTNAGSAGVQGIAAQGTGVVGTSDSGIGVIGNSNSTVADGNAIGVHGCSNMGKTTANYWNDEEWDQFPDKFVGVKGEGGDFGVYGIGTVGVCARMQPGGIAAAWFCGDVHVWGNHIVHGAKSAAVPHPDGSHRLLYSLECPESWFEDFGTGKLVKGRARVKLEKNFAALVRTRAYHVFLSPEGDSRGLYVSRQDAGGFEVREQQGGTTSVKFSYRVVAKRKDIAARRLVKTLPPLPTPKRGTPRHLPVVPALSADALCKKKPPTVPAHSRPSKRK